MAETDGGFALRIERSMAGLARLGGWVDTIAAALGLESTAEYALRLCLEEAAANLVMHGEPNGAGADAAFLAVRVQPGADDLLVTVEDRCAAFDPLQAAAPELPAKLENARVGGLGIHLMRQFARRIAYQRIGDVNRLTMEIGRARR